MQIRDNAGCTNANADHQNISRLSACHSIRWAGQHAASWCPFTRFQSASGSLSVQQKTPHISQRRKEIAIKKKKRERKKPQPTKIPQNFACHFLENAFLPLKIHNPEVKRLVLAVALELEKWEKSTVLQSLLSCMWPVQDYFLQMFSPVWLGWVSHTESFCPFLFFSSSRAEQSGDPGPIVELCSGSWAKGVERGRVGGRFQFQ